MPGDRGLVVTRPLAHAVLPVLIEALHDKVRWRNGNRQADFRIIRRSYKRQHPCSGCADDPDLPTALRFQKFDSLPKTLYRVVVVSVILFVW